MHWTSIQALLDRALDYTVLPGYTSLGYRLRGLTWDAAVAGAFVRGRAALVTGASSGIGEAICEGLAVAGARLYMVVRDRDRGERARERITARIDAQALVDPPHLEVCDLADLGSVRELAARVAEREPEVALLVNNAGVLPARRQLSPGGYELTFATNVLAPFLLTNLLLPTLRRSGPSRVINVCSGGMYTAGLDVDDLQFRRREYDGPRVYAHTKRIQVALTQIWAEREPPGPVEFFSMHPGWADTPGLARSLPRFHRLLRPLLRDPRQGADTVVWLGTCPQPGVDSGALVHDRTARAKHRLARTRETPAERDRLWAELSELSESAASTGATP